ncbi:Double homeobox protein 4 [Podochytrium sp. JEL0797]|nr:Double homeobox protein 4 [Podochytrium sp. JEL0797]
MTPNQLEILNARFATNQYLKENEASELSEKLGLTVKQVHNWYGKKRYTMKQKAGGGIPRGFGSIDDSASNASSSAVSRSWRRLTTAQSNTLTTAFEINPHLSTEDSEELAERLGLTVEKIRIWYATKRKAQRRLEDGDLIDGGGGGGMRDISPSPSAALGLNSSQTEMLNVAFASSMYLESHQAHQLSVDLGVTSEKVQQWFSRKRVAVQRSAAAVDSPPFTNSDGSAGSPQSPEYARGPNGEILSHYKSLSKHHVKTHHVLTHDQSQILNAAFLRTPYETEDGARDLASRTGLAVKQIQTWFSRKRFSLKKRKRSLSPEDGSGASLSNPTSDFKSYHMLTISQTNVLNTSYEHSPYVDDTVAFQISAEIGVPVEKVKTWFKSKRKLINKKKKLEGGEGEEGGVPGLEYHQDTPVRRGGGRPTTGMHSGESSAAGGDRVEEAWSEGDEEFDDESEYDEDEEEGVEGAILFGVETGGMDQLQEKIE